MTNIANLLNLFCVSPTLQKLTEDEVLVESNYTCNKISVPSEEALKESLKKFPARDSVILTIIYSESDNPISVSNNLTHLSEFITGLTAAVSNPSSSISINISIEKKNANAILSIYSLQTFFDYLNSLTFTELLSVFKKSFSGQQFLIFQTFEGVTEFNTQSIYFSNSAQVNASVFSAFLIERKEKMEKIKSVCHYGESGIFEFIPDDFKPVKQCVEIPEFNTLLNKITQAFCLLSLFDITTSSDAGIYYKLNGFKSISRTQSFSDLPVTSLNEYFKIYDWVYQRGGSVNDKIGLARNIISIHFESSDSIVIKGEAFQSLCSSHEIYLKQNIKQYIEIRNKIFEQLHDFNKKATTIVDSFASNFQKSIFGFVSFFSTAIIVRAISKGEFSLSPELTLLCFCFLAIAIIFLIYSRWELGVQTTRFTNSYNNMKKRFEDLLLPADIEGILNNNADYKDDLTFINSKKRNYTIMWVLVIILFAATIFWLYLRGSHPTDAVKIFPFLV